MTMPSANRVYNILAAGFMLAASAFAAGGARADNTTATMDVTLTILPGCSFGFGTNGSNDISSQTIDFGQITELNDDIPQSSNLYVMCSQGSDVQYKITMDKGLHYANGTRNMQAGGDTTKRIGYKICLPTEAGGATGCGTIWGDDTTLGKSYVAKWGQAAKVKNIPFDLVVPAVKGGLAAGEYTDTVQLQITW